MTTNDPADPRVPRSSWSLGRRGSKILVIVAVVLVVVLSYWSARVLIEGARNPDQLPTERELVEP